MKAWQGRPNRSLFPFLCRPIQNRISQAALSALLTLATIITPDYAHSTTTPALTTLTEISDAELADVSGQALIGVQKRIGDGGMNGQNNYTFTRVTIGASIAVNANIELLELGNYPIPSEDGHFWNVNGKDADIKATNVSFGCISCPGEEDMTMENPYVEFAYKNDGSANRRLVGVRIGFDQLNGWLSGNLESLSGNLSGELCFFGSVGCIPGGSHGPRSANLTGNILVDAKIPWEILHALPIGNVGNGGPARNFYFGFQTQQLDYPKNGNGPQRTAQPGFWINLEDGLNLTLSTGVGALFAKDNAYGPIAPSLRLTQIWDPFIGIIPLWIPNSPAVAARM